jgi:hypothetical protein
MGIHWTGPDGGAVIGWTDDEPRGPYPPLTIRERCISLGLLAFTAAWVYLLGLGCFWIWTVVAR